MPQQTEPLVPRGQAVPKNPRRMQTSSGISRCCQIVADGWLITFNALPLLPESGPRAPPLVLLQKSRIWPLVHGRINQRIPKQHLRQRATPLMQSIDLCRSLLYRGATAEIGNRRMHGAWRGSLCDLAARTSMPNEVAGHETGLAYRRTRDRRARRLPRQGPTIAGRRMTRRQLRRQATVASVVRFRMPIRVFAVSNTPQS